MNNTNPYLNPEHTALVIIDMQNDFCHEDGFSAQSGIADVQAFQATVPKIESLIEQAREVGVPIIFVYMTLDDSTISEAWKTRIKGVRGVVEKGTWGADFYKLFPQEGDYVVEKHRYSAFIGTNLDLILRSMNRKSIVLTGVLTNVCVESTARDGFMMDYNVTLVEDGCAGSSPSIHRAALDNLAATFGEVMPASAVAEYWAASKAAVI